MSCRRRLNLFRSLTAQSDRTRSRWRRISQRKLALLNHILDQAPIEGIDALKVQASSGKVLEARAGRGSWRLRTPGQITGITLAVAVHTRRYGWSGCPPSGREPKDRPRAIPTSVDAHDRLGAPYFLKVYGAALGSRASGRGRETDPFPHPSPRWRCGNHAGPFPYQVVFDPWRIRGAPWLQQSISAETIYLGSKGI